jgi:hypothetical protein
VQPEIAELLQKKPTINERSVFMPFFVEPGNDNARLSFLKRTVITTVQDIAAGNNFVSQDTVDEINSFVPEFEPKVNNLSKLLSDRSKEAREGTESLEILKMYERDLFDVVKRRTIRLGHPAEVLTLYQLPMDGIIPKPTTRGEWLTLAKKIIEGDAKAVEKGYPAIQNPSAEELNAVLQNTQKELDDIAIADREYDQAQEEIAGLRFKADELISDVMAELRFNLRKKDGRGKFIK